MIELGSTIQCEIGKDRVLQCLEYNSSYQWPSDHPDRPGITPKLKAILANKITKDLRELKATEGEEVMMKAWITIHFQICHNTVNFISKRINPLGIWRAVLKKAVKKARQDLQLEPRPISESLGRVVKDFELKGDAKQLQMNVDDILMARIFH